MDTQRLTYLLTTHFLRRDKKKSDFKYYKNKLNKIKELSKQKYLSTQFDMNKDNIKITWKLIGLIINMKKKTNSRINKHLTINATLINQIYVISLILISSMLLALIFLISCPNMTIQIQ